MTSALPDRSSALRLQIGLLVACILAALWAAVGWQHRAVEAEAARNAETHTTDLARAFAEYTESSFKRIDLVLLELRDDWLQQPKTFADAVRRRQEHLGELAFQAAIIDADGYLLYSNLKSTSDRVYLGDREHFKVHHERHEDRLFVSRPLKGRVSGRWTIQFTRPLVTNGRFAGVIVVSVDPGYFARFYQTVHLGYHGISVMVRDTSEVMARAPELESNIGKSITGTPYLGPAAPQAGSFRRIAQIDGRERIYGFRRLPAYGLSLVVGLATDEVMAPARERQRWLLGTAGTITVVLLAMAIIILRTLAGRERAENRLRESEQRLAAAIDGARLGTWDWDIPSGKVVYNARLAAMLGYSPETFAPLAASWEQRLHPDDRAVALAALDAHLRGDTPDYASEHRLRHNDGRWIWTLRSGRIVERDATGKPRRMVGIHLDVAEHKDAMSALAASEAHLRTLIESMDDMVMVVDTAGRIVEFHPSAHEPALVVDTVLGKKLDEAFPGVPGELLGEAIAAVKGDSRSHEAEVPLTIGEAERQFQFRVSPVSAGSPRPRAFLCVGRDVTAHNAAVSALRIAATTFESQEGMMVTDAAGHILRVNRAFTELTGYTAAEVVGRSPNLLKSGRQEAAFYRNMWQTLAETGYWQGEIWNRRKSGEVYPEWLTITAVTDPGGHITHYVGAFSDISDRKEAETQIRNLAFYDPLTNLPNRRLLLDRLGQALAAGSRSRLYGALLYLDLDDFKTLNDTRGHDAGDVLLTQVAERLRACVRECDTVSRLGGDEFVVMLDSLSQDQAAAASQAELVAEKIRLAIDLPYPLGDSEYHITPSIGVCLFRDHGDTIESLLKQADLALYQAKEAGRNTIRFYNAEMQVVVEKRAALETGMRHALERGEFELHYQPQVGRDGSIEGAEALLRWRHPERGMVPPGEFIPLAEESGMILPIGRWVLDTACRQIKDWETKPLLRDLRLSVNVSPRQVRQDDFVATVEAALAASGANPRRLEIEFTESLVLGNVEDTIAKMEALKRLGVGFSMDDFGTGYSSLAYLKRLPLDQLKIDQSFVHDVVELSDDAAIVQTIIAMSHALSLAVIAEGVETVAQREFLEANGCSTLQGYLLGRPMPLDEFERTVARGPIKL